MNFPSVSQFSIAKGTGGNKPPEMYIPLWWYSGSLLNVGSTSAGTAFIQKGTGNAASSTTGSAVKLHTLNANWSPSLKYALEISAYTSNSAGVYYAELWDITSNSAVSGSQISTTATSATVLRSSQFTLTPGHVYGLCVWLSSGSYNPYTTDASLIVFPS